MTGSLDEIERITIVTEKSVEVVPLRITGLGIAAVLYDALYMCVVYHLRKKNNFPDMGLMISNHGIAYPKVVYHLTTPSYPFHLLKLGMTNT